MLVIVAAHSRFTTGRMLPTRKTEDLLLGSWELIKQLGRVPRRLIWDNEPGIGRGRPPRRRCGDVHRHARHQDCAVAAQRPGVERHRRAAEPVLRDLVHARPQLRLTGELNAQFTAWLQRANAREVRHAIKARPVDLIETDRAKMLPLPPLPLLLGWCERVRLGRDYYVRLDASDYSVDPTSNRPDGRGER